MCGTSFTKKAWNQKLCSNSSCKEAYRRKCVRRKVYVTCEVCGHKYEMSYNYYHDGRRSNYRKLCERCKQISNELDNPEFDIVPQDPKETKFKELGLPPDAQEFPGLIWTF